MTRIYSRSTRCPEIVYRSARINAATKASFSLAPFVRSISLPPSPSPVYLSRSLLPLLLRSRHRRRTTAAVATTALPPSFSFYLFVEDTPLAQLAATPCIIYPVCSPTSLFFSRLCGGRAQRRATTNLRENIVAAIFHLKSRHTAVRRVVGRVPAIGRIFSR